MQNVNSGIKKIRPDHRQLSLHRTFGAVTQFPTEYNCDAGFGAPDQNTDGYPEGCTGYTQSELCQDEDGVQYKPSYTYGKTLQMEGLTGAQPVELRDSLKSLQVFGAQRIDETTDAQAMTHSRGKYFDVFDGSGLDKFDSIRSALLINAAEKRSVSVGTPWFPEFNQTPDTGIVPVPRTYNASGMPWHNWKICGWTTINGTPYLIGKPWIGKTGHGGFYYFSRDISNKLFSISGSAGFTIRNHVVPGDVQTVKLSLLQTIASYYQMLLKIINPQPTMNQTKQDMLGTFCTAIRDFEGNPGDLNYKNNNPGNVRCSPVGYRPQYGHVVCRNGFAVFQTYELGWEYLLNLVHHRAELHPNWTILDFFNAYAPTGDSNQPNIYAAFVAKHCGVSVSTTLATLFA